jgi:hypothetical protein
LLVCRHPNQDILMVKRNMQLCYYILSLEVVAQPGICVCVC